MRTAFLSDIHANLPALEAALEAARRLEADQIVVAGDLVGDGPHPVEVVAAVRDHAVACIRGNVDREVLKLARSGKKLGKELRQRKKKKSNRAWTALRLREAPAELEWLAGLDKEVWLQVDDHATLVVHGSPIGDTDFILPSLTPRGLLAKLEPLRGERPAILVSGHSHIPFSREVDGVLVVNCGSVGRPADGDPRGSLALVETSAASGLRARMVRFSYPWERVTEDLAARSVPGIDAREYELGIKT